MKFSVARLLLYCCVALAFAGALRFTPPLPDVRPAAEVFIQQAGAPSRQLRVDTLGRGETLGILLRRAGLSDDDVARALSAAPSLNERRVRPGLPVTIRSEAADSAPSEVMLQLAVDRILHLKRTGGSWTGTEEKLPWLTDTVVVTGTIRTNLYAAMDESVKDELPSPARNQLAWSLADIYDYKVDMSRDLQRGDEFKVMAERQVGPSGVVRMGTILAATFKLSGGVLKAVRFASASVMGDYFDQDGKSMRTAFLRAPLEFRRISSVFGGREHPILGGWRQHKGTDYAAAMGTPVRAIGDGVIVRAGWGNGYGNVLEVRHRNGFVTRYGHLSRFAGGIRPGTHVAIGQTIAFVGSTGLSTGPHLHFEVLVDGVQCDPRVALKRTGGDPIPAGEVNVFASLRDDRTALLDTLSKGGVTKVAAR